MAGHFNEILCRFLHSCVGILLAICLTSTSASAGDAADTAPTLTLDDAIQLAMKGNRILKVADLEVAKSEEVFASARTHRLPAISTSAFASQLLTPIDFTFSQGAFGTYPGIGPVPAQNTNIRTPLRPVFHIEAEAVQPILQLYKINLGLQSQAVAIAVNREQYRAQRQLLANNVKQAYYAVLQSESAVQTANSSLQEFQELDRIVSKRLSQESALKSDSLDVKAKLADQRYRLAQLDHRLRSQKEYLNNLLGRDIRTEFQTQPVPPLAPVETSLTDAQQTALAHRPEIKVAELTTEQADYARRIARAEYLPDLGFGIRYLSSFNVNMLPSNIAMAGFDLKWEPWDWGRRRHDVSVKKLTLEQSQQQLQETQNKVLLEVNDNFRKLQEDRLMLDACEIAREAAHEKLRVITSRYSENAVLISDVLQQTASVASAEDNYQQALLAFWAAKADFEKSLGEDQ
jgi:outer membrane protein TolC